MKKIFILFSLCFLLFNSCGQRIRPVYRIGVDPTWYHLELMGKEKNLLGFSTDLLKEIGMLKKINIELIMRSWDNLAEGLKEESYAAILSTITPYLFNRETYDFSDIYLSTGPVLIVSASSSVTSLKEMEGKEVAIQRGSQNEPLFEKYPGVLLRIYDSIPQALNDVAKQVIDGAIVDILTAEGYVQDIYHGELKIATPPLNKEGVRLITLHGKEAKLIENFNEGLRELKENGVYSQLARKWSL
jgi:polar amino acid transport system substrate-binding protein